MDEVFRALADPKRRRLLDQLADTDGLSLGKLCEVLPDMTRFGVMKHLAVLEGAHLITTERHGRRKLHYLNPVPIQVIHDRWISRYATPFTEALASLANKPSTEADHDCTPTHLRDVHQGNAG